MKRLTRNEARRRKSPTTMARVRREASVSGTVRLANAKESIPGSILTVGEIERRLENGEIFAEGTWDKRNLRAAGYDLRLARELLITPNEQGDKFIQYRRCQYRANRVILHPGEVAFVSSVESLRMPWDVVGTLGAKFSLASQGVLMLTGLSVDPGYGMIHAGNRDQQGKDDRRLHFLLANVGAKIVELTPGSERIATVQFTTVPEIEEKERFSQFGYSSQVEDRFFDPLEKAGAGLEFLTKLKRSSSDAEENMKKVNESVQILEERINGIENGSQQILMFGVYLSCITIIGVSIAAIFSVIGSIEVSLDWPNAFVFAVGILAIAGVTFTIFHQLKNVPFLSSQRDN